MLRTLPTIWINFVNDMPHCWIPKSGYSHKLRNMVCPPNETDIDGRKEWHYSECEILFGREYYRLNDGEMALSEMNYGPEWYINPAEHPTLDVLSIESSSSSNQVMDHSTNALTSNVNEDCLADKSPSNITDPEHLLNKSSKPSIPFEEQNAVTENELSSNIPASLPLNESVEPSKSSGRKRPFNNNKISEIEIPPQKILSDLEQYIENKRLCQLEGFQPPIHYKKFANLQFRFVRTVINDLQAGNKFKTLEELSMIPRKYDKPFCRPGPLKREEWYDWYLVDSIVQEVYLKSAPTPFFVVRWVGYEDEYNTVEPLENVKHTAVHKLFTSTKMYTACHLNGCILRRSERNVPYKVIPTVAFSLQLMDIEPSIYERAMNKLITELRIEENAGRYSACIGFCSEQGVADALLAQHRFFIDKFCPLINQLESPVYLDQHYIGPIFGNVGQAAAFKKLIKDGNMMVVTNSSSLKDYISRGFSKHSAMSEDLPRYVSFIAQRKFDTAERHDEVHLNFHMSVFTVRSHGRLKDAIYYDPSPQYFTHKLPPVLDKLTVPVLKSFTHKFGVASEKDDCTFRCMRYIIGLATGEVLFEPDVTEPCRRIDKFMMAKKAAKRMKFD